ncbi:MAG: DUF4340 domain-containing protein [Bacteroidota bacterium]|nr:DUF4340 domain-containing protein [Bacteroidota bacterium]
MRSRRNTLLLLLLLVVIAAITFIAYINKGSGTLGADPKAFAVEDVHKIGSIMLTDRSGVKAVLEEQSPGQWTINGKYPVAEDRLDNLLEAVKSVEIKGPVSLSARESVIKTMASGAVEVEIYDEEGNLLKHYYVGGTTPDELGTMMLLEDDDEPYVTHIPGFNGFLNVRYFTQEQEWRSRQVLALKPEELRTMEVSFPGDPGSSFRFTISGTRLSISRPDGSGVINPPLIEGKRYLMAYRKMYFENFATLPQAEADSLLRSLPYAVINISTAKGKLPALTLYLKQGDQRTKELSAANIDKDRFYAALGSDPKELLVVQRMNFEPVIRTYDSWLQPVLGSGTE